MSQALETISPATDNALDARASRHVGRSTLTDSLATLASLSRDVLLLSDVRGLSSRAIGMALGIDPVRVQIVLQQARRAVRQQLVDEVAMPVPGAAAR